MYMLYFRGDSFPFVCRLKVVTWVVERLATLSGKFNWYVVLRTYHSYQPQTLCVNAASGLNPWMDANSISPEVGLPDRSYIEQLLGTN